MILILGIVSIVCCGLLGPVAWYMGNEELKLIRAGTVDSSNEGSAKAGMICGIIATILLGLGIFFVFLGVGAGVLGGILESL